MNSLLNHRPRIPWTQLLPIILLRISDGIAYVVIFPSIVSYLSSLPAPHHVKTSCVGLYAGIAEGGLMFVEAVAAVGWAKLSDTVGRKKTVIGGFTAALCFGPLVGFGNSVWWIIAMRSLGAFRPVGTDALLPVHQWLQTLVCMSRFTSRSNFAVWGRGTGHSTRSKEMFATFTSS